MAGLVVCMGKESEEIAKEINSNFVQFKGLDNSFEFNDGGCSIYKYKRLYDNEDTYYYESSNFVVCAVGSIIYKTYDFKESLKSLANDLDDGMILSSLIDEIDGTFCLVIINKIEQQCYIINDIGGVINTYIYQKDDLICISTSMLALAKTIKISPDISAILMYIRSGMFFDENTYFKEIKTLKAASVYEYNFKRKTLVRREYWSVPKEVDHSVSFDFAKTKITNELSRIINAVPNKDALYDFTGGYDARFILSLAYSQEYNKKKLNAFFFGPPNSHEAKIVESNCNNLGIKYHNYVVQDDWPNKFYDYVLKSHRMCDGLEDACSYAAVLMTQELKRRDFAYSIHGSLGELYRQRPWEFELGVRGKARPAKLGLIIKYRNLVDDFDNTIFSERYLKELFYIPNILLHIYRKSNSIFNEKTPNTLQLDYIIFCQRARRFGGRTFTTANQIIQTICPFYFRKPLEFSFALPPKYKKKCMLMRSIIQREAPDMARQKMINNTPFVLMDLKNLYLFAPAVLFFLKKVIRKISQIVFGKTIWAGLTTPDYNTGIWYRTALLDERCKALLSYENMISRSLYNRETFKDFIRRAGSDDFHFYGQLGRIITVELTLQAIQEKQDWDVL